MMTAKKIMKYTAMIAGAVLFAVLAYFNFGMFGWIGFGLIVIFGILNIKKVKSDAKKGIQPKEIKIDSNLDIAAEGLRANVWTDFWAKDE